MAEVKQEYNPKNMIFRRLGPSGLRVPVFSYGGWLTVGGSVVGDPVKDLIKTAFDNGINMIDTAEVYAAGNSESEIGRVIKELGYRRTDLVIATKIYFGTRKGPNDTGLSRKQKLTAPPMDYVDIVFAHRPDSSVPMEETVRAFNWIIDQGWAFYWGTSEWSAREIEAAHNVAKRLNLVGPIAEQCQHNMFHRDRPEKEYQCIAFFVQFLTYSKYNDGIPQDSRFARESFFAGRDIWLESEEGKAQVEKVRALTKFAKEEFDTSVASLALAWVAKHPNTSTPEQVLENLKALEVLPKITDEHMKKIDELLGNAPEVPVPQARAPYDEPRGRY
ncbi:Aldo keto reductase [Flagelloscypha sp. PMI_526]|nr:Aldo keto reductase [Flagelloscypha sp. PMI_526]